MTTLVLKKDPVAVSVSLSSEHLTLELADGRQMLVPLEWYPRLMNASKAERQNWRLIGGGYAIEWPDLDEHIGVEGLLAGNRSGESAHSLNRWLASRTKQDKKKKANATRKHSKKKAE
jgi:hypothetical protein